MGSLFHGREMHPAQQHSSVHCDNKSGKWCYLVCVSSSDLEPIGDNFLGLLALVLSMSMYMNRELTVYGFGEPTAIAVL